jgi:hypothetical protein
LRVYEHGDVGWYVAEPEDTARIGSGRRFQSAVVATLLVDRELEPPRRHTRTRERRARIDVSDDAEQQGGLVGACTRTHRLHERRAIRCRDGDARLA